MLRKSSVQGESFDLAQDKTVEPGTVVGKFSEANKLPLDRLRTSGLTRRFRNILQQSHKRGKTMKNLLLLFLALILTPAWAEDVAAPPAQISSTQTTLAAPDVKAGYSLTAPKSDVVKGLLEKLMGKDAGAAVESCPAGCALMACPPPSGPVRCCNTTTLKAC
jgi:hypothetical protein